jgi:hypothetical protein
MVSMRSRADGGAQGPWSICLASSAAILQLCSMVVTSLTSPRGSIAASWHVRPIITVVL